MSSNPGTSREFVGFVWPEDDFWDQTGLLLLAADVVEARLVAREAYGDAFRLSLWNEEDSAAPR